MSIKKIFPGWLIVISGFLIMATCYAVFVDSISLFLVPVTTDLGIMRAQFNANLSIAAVVAVFASLLIGKLVDRYNARLLGMASVILSVITMLGWSQLTAVWQIYVLSFIEGFVIISGTRLLISILVANWFDKRRGLALSIALSGSGVGGVIMTLIASYLIAAYGWRTAFLILAIITFICAFPLTFFLYNLPSDLGLLPYGAAKTITSDQAQTYSPTGIESKIAVRSTAFWLLAIGFLLMGLINGAVIMNEAANFTDAGHTAEFASRIVSLELFVCIFGKIALGSVYDKFGLIFGTMLGSITTILATLSMAFAYTMAAPFLFALFYGFGTCLGTVAPPIMVVYEFGKRDVGSLIGYVTAIEMFGGAIGAISMGRLYDITGSYTLGWFLLTGLGLIMTIILLLSANFAKRLPQFSTEKQ